MSNGFCPTASVLQSAQQALTFPPLSLWLVFAISPSAHIVLQSVNIRRPEHDLPLPPFGKHEELEADWSRLGWTPSKLDNAIWSYSRPTREHDPDLFIVALKRLNKVQESQLSSNKTSHEVEALLWLNFGGHEPFIFVPVSDCSLFCSLLGGHQYPEGLSRGADADEAVLAAGA